MLYCLFYLWWGIFVITFSCLNGESEKFLLVELFNGYVRLYSVYCIHLLTLAWHHVQISWKVSEHGRAAQQCFKVSSNGYSLLNAVKDILLSGNICFSPHPLTGNMPSPNAPLKRVLAYTGCFSRMSTIKDIHEYLSQRLRIKEEDMRLWLYNSEVSFSVASLCYSPALLQYFIKMYLWIAPHCE